MAIDVNRRSAAIVLVGQFNPIIFSPEWLFRMGVVNKKNLEAASIEVIHKSLAKFQVGEFEFEVSENRCVIGSEAEPFVMVQETALKVFGEHLAHTHLHQMGINYHEAFTVPETKQRLELGRKLAPVEPWGEFGKRLLAGQTPKMVGGMVNLEMKEPLTRFESDDDFRKVSIASANKPNPFCSVTMSVNDHYNSIDLAPEENSKRLIQILDDAFEESIQCSRSVVDDMKQFTEKLGS